MTHFSSDPSRGRREAYKERSAEHNTKRQFSDEDSCPPVSKSAKVDNIADLIGKIPMDAKLTRAQFELLLQAQNKMTEDRKPSPAKLHHRESRSPSQGSSRRMGATSQLFTNIPQIRVLLIGDISIYAAS